MDAELTLLLETQPGGVPEWIKLLPLGEVALGDGREPFCVDREALDAMTRHFEARGLDLVIDYEHQTLSGGKAPAAGWIRELAAREDGLWARVEWTETARRHLMDREYRYFSPVLRLEEKTRRPMALLHAALTNTPAINGLEPLVGKGSGQWPVASGQAKSSGQWPVVSGQGKSSGQWSVARGQGKDSGQWPVVSGQGKSSGQWSVASDQAKDRGQGEGGKDSSRRSAVSSQQTDGKLEGPQEGLRILLRSTARVKEEENLEELLERMKNALGLQAEAGEAEVLALAAAKLEAAPDFGEVAGLLDLPRDAGPARIRGAILALKNSQEQLVKLQEECAALAAEAADRQARDAVESGMKAGKIQPCQQESALRYARADLEGFKTFVEKSLPVVPMGRLETAREEAAAAKEDLNSQVLAVCEALGIAPENFKDQERRLRAERLL
ncbi:MAG: phage protease [Deltaproteobacteria bacterium]|nr:phage protease [Deltaproteobacteria bacterium]